MKLKKATARFFSKGKSMISSRTIRFAFSSFLYWKQKDLAEKIGVSPQQVSKWVKGNENFTLETLVGLSEVLDAELIAVAPKKDQKLVEEVKFTHSEEYAVFMSQKRLVPRITINENTVYENPYAVSIAN